MGSRCERWVKRCNYRLAPPWTHIVGITVNMGVGCQSHAGEGGVGNGKSERVTPILQGVVRGDQIGDSRHCGKQWDWLLVPLQVAGRAENGRSERETSVLQGQPPRGQPNSGQKSLVVKLITISRSWTTVQGKEWPHSSMSQGVTKRTLMDICSEVDNSAVY